MIPEVHTITLTNKRKVNEDFYFYDIKKYREKCCSIYAIADGIGSLKDGDIASKMAIAHTKMWWDRYYKSLLKKKKMLEWSDFENINDIFNISNESILKHAAKHKITSGTTLTICIVYEETAFIFHLGDCKVIQLKNTGVSELTFAHNLISEENKKTLTHWLGSYSSSQKRNPFLCTRQLSKNDFLLIGSDGAFNLIDEKELINYYRSNYESLTPKNITKYISDFVIQKGEKDNITIIAIRF